MWTGLAEKQGWTQKRFLKKLANASRISLLFRQSVRMESNKIVQCLKKYKRESEIIFYNRNKRFISGNNTESNSHSYLQRQKT